MEKKDYRITTRENFSHDVGLHKSYTVEKRSFGLVLLLGWIVGLVPWLFYLILNSNSDMNGMHFFGSEAILSNLFFLGMFISVIFVIFSQYINFEFTWLNKGTFKSKKLAEDYIGYLKTK